MLYWGKWFGALLGFLSGLGFWGVLLGFFIGNIVDLRLRTRNQHFFSDQKNRQSLFFCTTFQVMGHITKSKGRVTETDIQLATTLMDRMQLHGEARAAAQAAFREGKENDFPLRKKLQQLRGICLGRVDLIKMFLEIQFQAAFSDGILHPNERQVLYVISEELGISQRQFHQFLNMMESGSQFGHKNWYQHATYSSSGRSSQNGQAPTLSDACKVLGVNVNDNSATIKRAYRKLMSENHPDKLIAKGLPPEMMEIAKEKTQKIQAAYNFIKREKGFK
ncbi:molecular chaperone DjlA [Candidatus Williamhamiltonella defendens]|uniref:Co-chaperone protein DjlA n=1 Tax=Hamiltonella defensa subsp. Acyrthosiphon pisum (strain 5AT) TaxID=572265 RepID=C4K7L0_HAMD5|nr:co-chaperone DjlA [Candidatus Hamiltonella defensa]ACQ68553.1 co-chaperone of DnaK (DnaJ-like), implicated in regulation of colanic acid capsule [Candidatus Hamiltonella defensa 5AT (Acyrthosiphon pisum)]ATW23095.1 molecular chaperone DjlA [Candidatus Hamiltonella defensa]